MRFKNEVVVGMVVTAALVTVAIGAYFLTGRPWGGGNRELRAAFRDVGLLNAGNRVKYRGVTIGRVEEVQLLPRGDGVAVKMSLQSEVPFPRDAGVVLSAESFFGDWQAEIVSRSSPQYKDLEWVEVREPNVLPGAALPDITELTAVAGRIAGSLDTLSYRVRLAFTEETALDIRKTIENVSEVSDKLEGFIDKQTRTYDAVGQNVLASTANIREATATARQAAGSIQGAIDRGDIQAILGNARQSSENLRLFSEQLNSAAGGIPGLMARADTTLASFGRTADQAGAAIEGLRPALDSLAPTLNDARAAIQTLNRAAAKIEEGNGTLGRLIADPALYEETQRAIVTLRRLLADLQQNPGKYIGEVKVF
jgi:phospholipid/cholesterol/gamma-HCH transport system substrate-binding protein